MPTYFRDLGNALEWRAKGETLRVEPWGPDAVRVRATPGGPLLGDLPGALLDAPPAGGEAEIKIGEHHATLVNGRLTVRIDAGTEGQLTPELGASAGSLTFLRTEDGTELLAEQPAHFWWPGPRLATATGNGHHRLEQRFRAYPGERLYGLGQHTHGLLNQKGAVIDLVHVPVACVKTLPLHWRRRLDRSVCRQRERRRRCGAPRRLRFEAGRRLETGTAPSRPD